MALPWFRYYSEDLEYDQVIDMTDLEFRAWIILQSLASQEEVRGRLPETRKVARRFVALGVRVSEGRSAQLLTLFRERGLLVEDPDTGRLMPFNWGRQKPSDDGQQRMAEYRHRERTGAAHVQHSGRTKAERVTVFPSSSSSSTGSKEVNIDSFSEIDSLSQLELTEEEEEGSSAQVQHKLKVSAIASPLQEEIEAALTEIGLDCVLHCIDIACSNNKLSWAYVEATRRGHVQDGCPADITQTRRERLMAGGKGGNS